MDQAIADSPSGVISPNKMHDMLRERGRCTRRGSIAMRRLMRGQIDQRIRSLEESIHRLSEHMSGMRDEVHVISKTLYTKVRDTASCAR